MFEWKLEDMYLLKYGYTKETSDNFTAGVTPEDKINFVDSLNERKLSYILRKVSIFNKDKQRLFDGIDMSGDKYMDKICSWLTENDELNMFSRKSGRCSFVNFDFGINNTIYNSNEKYITALIDSIFHNQLKMCKKLEMDYYKTQDPFEIELAKLIKNMESTNIRLNIKLIDELNQFGYHMKMPYFNGNNLTLEDMKNVNCQYDLLANTLNTIENNINTYFSVDKNVNTYFGINNESSTNKEDIDLD